MNRNIFTSETSESIENVQLSMKNLELENQRLRFSIQQAQDRKIGINYYYFNLFLFFFIILLFNLK
jgi:hypothetical protein